MTSLDRRPSDGLKIFCCSVSLDRIFKSVAEPDVAGQCLLLRSLRSFSLHLHAVSLRSSLLRPVPTPKFTDGICTDGELCCTQDDTTVILISLHLRQPVHLRDQVQSRQAHSGRTNAVHQRARAGRSKRRDV